MLRGGERSAWVRRFDPTSPDLDIEFDSAGTGTGHRALVAAERVAYIAFAEARGAGPIPSAAPIKVHISGASSFEVLADPDRIHDRVGFWAWEKKDDDKHVEFFFYAHGINAKEQPDPIGKLLVDKGLVSPATLAAGMAAQSAARDIPLGQILVEQNTVSVEQVSEAAQLQHRRKMRIGEILIEAGSCTPEDIAKALDEQKRRRGRRLGEVLVEMGVLTEVDLSLTLANKFNMPFVNLDEVSLNVYAMREVPRDVISNFGILPIDTTDTTLTVATSDPLAVDGVEAIRMHQAKRVQEVLATPTQLRRFVDGFLGGSAGGGGGKTRTVEEFDAILKRLQSEEISSSAELHDEEDATVDASDSAIIKLVNKIILDAYRSGASDIHIEPNGPEALTVIRFRVDGECDTYQEVPAHLRASLVSRIKIMANLDIAERRKPQDGKIRFKVQDKRIELRVASLPTANNNEDIVMRILAASKPLPVTGLRLSPRNLRELQSAVRKPYGLVLCVGPTGSGKTTTLHSALGSINTVGRKIWTAEDPVEITQPGLRQVQINPKINFTFAHAMRAFLRADPDVIMVGEMRDQETASIAIEASLTGHLVFSTLHTNNAPETVTRLLDMGIDRFTFADALIAVLAQRLARSLCEQCREQGPATDEEYDTLVNAIGEDWLAQRFGAKTASELTLYRAKGCNKCNKKGYAGRIALHELLVANDELKQAIAREARIDELRQCAMKAGMTTLFQDGVEKAVAGQTDIKQVLAVCSR